MKTVGNSTKQAMKGHGIDVQISNWRPTPFACQLHMLKWLPSQCFLPVFETYEKHCQFFWSKEVSKDIFNSVWFWNYSVLYFLNIAPLGPITIITYCIHCETFLIFMFSWQACSKQTIGSSVAVYFAVAIQNTSDCVLGENGKCVLTYTGTALLRYEGFFVMLFHIMNFFFFF